MKIFIAVCATVVLAFALTFVIRMQPQNKSNEKYPLSDAQAYRLKSEALAFAIAQRSAADANAALQKTVKTFNDDLAAIKKQNKFPDSVVIRQDTLFDPESRIQIVDAPKPAADVSPASAKPATPAK